MFSGIIRATAEIKGTEEFRGECGVAIPVPQGWELPLGASVSVDGICSTVDHTVGDTFIVIYMPETRRVTTASDFSAGRKVNLELPLRIGDTLDGHFVQGHVDGVAVVSNVASEGGSYEITFRVPKELHKFVAHKGSIAVNGVALTVARVKGGECTVALIPYTLAHTNLGTLAKGTRVNIEIDLIARYLAKLRQK